MDTIFMNSENSRTAEYHVLVLKLTDKLDFKIGETNIALSNLSIYYTWKNVKSSYNNNKFKISAPTWRDKFNYQMDNQIFKIISNISLENIVIIHPSIRIYVNEIENRITFKIKNGYYFELLTPKNNEIIWKR